MNSKIRTKSLNKNSDTNIYNNKIHNLRNSYSNINIDSNFITLNNKDFNVFVRIRPLDTNNNYNCLVKNTNNYYHLKLDKCIQSVVNYNKNTNEIKVVNPCIKAQSNRKFKCYSFKKNNVFTEDNCNIYISNIISPDIVDNIISGYNSTLINYGVTSSGKTFTMFGSLLSNDENHTEGLCSHTINSLFKKLEINNYKIVSYKEFHKYIEDISSNKFTENNNNFKKYVIKASFIEIYNEYVIDLLQEYNKSFNLNNVNNNSKTIYTDSNNLLVIEDPIKGIVIPGLNEIEIKNLNDLKNLILNGIKYRKTAPTFKNEYSSRSHSIIQISLDRLYFKNKNYTDIKTNINSSNIGEYSKDQSDNIISTKLLFVDLAGCEKGGVETNVKRIQEGININKSLLSLSTCINLLSDKKKKGCFIPYRNSKLTRILKESLGGNSRTTMIACINPSKYYWEETNNTLQYAFNAMNIEKKVHKDIKSYYFRNPNILDNDSDINSMNFVDANSSSNRYLIPKTESLDYNDNNNIVCSLKKEIEQLKKIIEENNSFLNNDNNVENLLVKLFSYNFNENNKTTNAKFEKLDNNENTRKNFYHKTLNKSCQDLTIFDLETLCGLVIKDMSDIEKKIRNKMSKYNNVTIKHDNHKDYIDEIKSILANEYQNIKTIIEKSILLVNDYLLNNIEQNMILKYNLKEILELNKKNNYILESLKTSNINNSCEKNQIENNIKDNEIEKKSISSAFINNVNDKKRAKALLLKLINASQFKDISDNIQLILKDYFNNNSNNIHDKINNNFCNNENINKLIKEKEELIQKNENYAKYLNNMINQNKEKDKKLKTTQNLLNNIKIKYNRNNNSVNKNSNSKTKKIMPVNYTLVNSRNLKKNNINYLDISSNKLNIKAVFNSNCCINKKTFNRSMCKKSLIKNNSNSETRIFSNNKTGNNLYKNNNYNTNSTTNFNNINNKSNSIQISRPNNYNSKVIKTEYNRNLGNISNHKLLISDKKLLLNKANAKTKTDIPNFNTNNYDKKIIDNSKSHKYVYKKSNSILLNDKNMSDIINIKNNNQYEFTFKQSNSNFNNKNLDYLIKSNVKSNEIVKKNIKNNLSRLRLLNNELEFESLFQQKVNDYNNNKYLRKESYRVNDIATKNNSTNKLYTNSNYVYNKANVQNYFKINKNFKKSLDNKLSPNTKEKSEFIDNIDCILSSKTSPKYNNKLMNYFNYNLPKYNKFNNSKNIATKALNKCNTENNFKENEYFFVNYNENNVDKNSIKNKKYSDNLNTKDITDNGITLLSNKSMMTSNNNIIQYNKKYNEDSIKIETEELIKCFNNPYINKSYNNNNNEDIVSNLKINCYQYNTKPLKKSLSKARLERKLNNDIKTAYKLNLSSSCKLTLENKISKNSIDFIDNYKKSRPQSINNK